VLARILREALRRHPRRAVTAVLAVAVGTALATGLLGVSLDITEKMARELRSYGANILVTPRAAGLQLEIGDITISPPNADGRIDENELARLKTIFWRHNIVGFAPFVSGVVRVGDDRAVLTGTWFDKPVTLPAGVAVRTEFAREEKTTEAEVFRTGVRAIASWWQVEGEWASDGDAGMAMVGARVAARLGLRPGRTFKVRYDDRERTLQVAGLITTGGDEEEQIFVPLSTAQRLLGLAFGVDKVLVSALVEPDDKLRSDLRGLDPSEMTPEQYETWYCSPIMAAVLTQIEEALPDTRAAPIRRIADAEGAFLSKIGLLMTLLTVTALLGAALAVMTTMTAAVLERRAEIGLMKAIGADDRQVALIFLSQASLIGLSGGLLGYLAGLWVTAVIGRQVFATAVPLPLVVLPITLFLALAVALAGSVLPVRRATRFHPVVLLREG